MNDDSNYNDNKYDHDPNPKCDLTQDGYAS